MNKEELLKKIDEAQTIEEVRALQAEVEARKAEEEKVEEKADEKPAEEITVEEERSLLRKSAEGLKLIKEEKKMEEKRKFTIADEEYRSAWAKTFLGKKLTEEEERALGDAVGTTATTFVASDADTQGINNLGLLIPTSMRMDLLERATKESPIFRDIRKLNINGNIDLPYLFTSDDANWLAELVDTPNEGQEYKGLKLTGYELAKDIVITWKAEAMTVDGFISFMLDELYEKMMKAVIKTVIYGDGSGKPTGITNGLTPIEQGATTIDTIKATLTALNEDARIGAKTYVAQAVGDDLTFYKDENGNYPYLLPGLTGTYATRIEIDPFLNGHDIVAGNMKNYIYNENQAMSFAKETTIKGRKTTYGAYMICDGMPRPGYFAYGQDETVSA